MKIRKATDTEKTQWADKKELYPLFGFVKVPGSLGGTLGHWQCALEYLGEGPDEPNYELHAPDGMRFDYGTHTILATTQRDLFDQCPRLEVCAEVGCEDH